MLYGAGVALKSKNKKKKRKKIIWKGDKQVVIFLKITEYFFEGGRDRIESSNMSIVIIIIIIK